MSENKIKEMTDSFMNAINIADELGVSIYTVEPMNKADEPLGFGVICCEPEKVGEIKAFVERLREELSND